MPLLYQHLINHFSELLQQVKTSPGTRIYNLSVPHFALFLLFRTDSFIVIEDSTESADALYNDLLFFSQLVPEHGGTISYFPPASSPELIGKRASVLLAGVTQSKIGIITSPEAWRTGFSIPLVKDAVITIRRGLSIERDTLNKMLSGLGYKKVSVVVEKGEYSQREWIFDIFPTTEDIPLRVEFFGDEIEMMRSFDIETQRSIREAENLTVLPAEEDDPNRTIIDELAYSINPEVFVVQDIAVSIPELPVDRLPFYSVSHLSFAGEGTDGMEHSIKGMGIVPEERKELGDIPSAIKKAGYDTLIVLPSQAQAERMKDILFDGGVIAPVIKVKDLESYAGSICIVTGTL
ncbi:MAG TPA: hypothetical protein VEJ88_03110 [Dissulfurispiraceae bacterium]|nr:hypothetical protein [Dissulfurispiraceae bacterium]